MTLAGRSHAGRDGQWTSTCGENADNNLVEESGTASSAGKAVASRPSPRPIRCDRCGVLNCGRWVRPDDPADPDTTFTFAPMSEGEAAVLAEGETP
jgi:hypothetical protein